MIIIIQSLIQDLNLGNSTNVMSFMSVMNIVNDLIYIYIYIYIYKFLSGQGQGCEQFSQVALMIEPYIQIYNYFLKITFQCPKITNDQ